MIIIKINIINSQSFFKTIDVMNFKRAIVLALLLLTDKSVLASHSNTTDQIQQNSSFQYEQGYAGIVLTIKKNLLCEVKNRML